MDKLAKLLTDNASMIVIAAAILAYLTPKSFLWVSGTNQTLILGFIMLTMGLTLSTNDFRILASRPGDIIIGTLAQFSIMPIVAFAISRLFNLNVSLALGLTLVGCCPGGVSSNLMSYLCKGDVAFSVGMTTVSTLLAPFVTPLLVLVIAGQDVDIDAWGMFQGILLVTLLPISIGFGLNLSMNGKTAFDTIRKVMPSFSVIALSFIVAGVVAQVKPNIEAEGLSILLLTFGAVLCHNFSGYALGFAVGSLFGFRKEKKRTISIEVGMQNAGLATNLASQFFLASNPISVVPCAISCAWHSISGTLLATMFAKQDQRNGTSFD